MAFTTGGLMVRESLQASALFAQLGDWSAVREHILRENTLQVRKVSSAQRLTREVIFRLQELSSDELDFLGIAESQDQANLVWIAACRRFTFIADFMREVVRERYFALRDDLAYPDFDAFLEHKGGRHSELTEISSSTRAKLRQVLFRMLREANLLGKDNKILKPSLGRELATLIVGSNVASANYFPIAERDLRSLAK